MENYDTLTTGTFRVCYSISALIFRKMLCINTNAFQRRSGLAMFLIVIGTLSFDRPGTVCCRCCVFVSHATPVKPSAIPSMALEQTLHTVLLMWHLIELGSGSHKLTAFYCNTGSYYQGLSYYYAPVFDWLNSTIQSIV